MDNIPKLLQYFIPGYWSILVFQYFTSKKISKYMMNLMACVVSYMLISFVSLIRIKFESFQNMPDRAIINSGIAILIGTILSIIFALIFTCKWFSKVTVFLFQKTPNEDIWRDIFDLKNGSNIKIYLKNEDYYVIGHFKNQEEKGEDSWIALSAFAKYDKETNKNYKSELSFLNDETVIYTVRLSDIEHIEIF